MTGILCYKIGDVTSFILRRKGEMTAFEIHKLCMLAFDREENYGNVP